MLQDCLTLCNNFDKIPTSDGKDHFIRRRREYPNIESAAKEEINLRKRITCLVLVCAVLFTVLTTTVTAEESTSANEKEIYEFLTNEMGLNTAAACGIMGNSYYETGFRANITVSSYFGLFMYYAPLGNELREWCVSHLLDYTTVRGQMEFLRAMFNGEVSYYDYSDLYETLLAIENTADGAYTAGSVFCTEFEKPENTAFEANKRGVYASGTLFPKYAGSLKESTGPSESEAPIAAPNSFSGVVTADLLNVRSGAGTSYRIVSTLTRGQTVTVTSQESAGGLTWYRISGGWVCADYIGTSAESAGSAAEEASVSAGAQYGSYTVTASALNVRSSAGLGSAIIDCLGRGRTVSVTEEKTENGMVWCHLSSGGWVCKDYLSADGASSSASASGTGSSAASANTSSYAVTASGLNVRSGAGTSFPVVDCYPRGTRVSVTETASSGGTSWGKLTNGYWVCMTYLTAA